MQHEAVFVRAFERIDDRRVAQRAERCHDDCLRLAAREKRRTVRFRQDPDFDRNRPDLAQVAPVDSRFAVQHALPDDLLFELAEITIDIRCVELRRVATGERFYRTGTQCADLCLALLLVRRSIRSAEIRFDRLAECSGQHFVLRHHGNLPTRFPGLRGELLDRVDRDLHRVVAEQHAAEHLIFRQLLRFRLNHQHSRRGTRDNHVQSRLLQSCIARDSADIDRPCTQPARQQSGH